MENYCILGTDNRSVKLRELYRREGKKISDYIDADYIIAPMPFTKDECCINGETLSIDELLTLSDIEHKIIFTGAVSSKIRNKLEEKQVTYYDLLERDEMTVLNAIPTAEGAIQTAMEITDFTLCTANVLVIGYDKIGTILAKMLHGIGANVSVVVESQEQLAQIRAMGYNPICFTQVNDMLSTFQVIFNTIAHITLHQDRLVLIDSKCSIIDLASHPGGVDFASAKQLHLNVVWALAIPGKVAPLSAAIYMKEAVDRIVNDIKKGEIRMIVDVKTMVENNKKNLKIRVGELKEKGIVPKLVVILASYDKASEVYVSKKREMCKEMGIAEEEYLLEEKITNDELIDIIEKLNQDKAVDGILVQLPLYSHLNEKEILQHISPMKDVDGLHPLNLGNLLSNKEGIVSCTPKGILSIMEELHVNLEGKDAVVVGRSVLVGKPIAQLLLNKGATVTVCHSKTADLAKHTRQADILVVAVGKKHLITEDMVKEGSIIVDVGINRVEGKIYGDVDTDAVDKVARYITPVPGGVGLTTVLSLLQNVTEVAQKRLLMSNLKK